MYIWVLVTLFLFWGSGDASKPGCCMPKKFEAVEMIQIGSSSDDDNGHGSLQEMVLDVAVDGTQKKVNVAGVSYKDGKETRFRVIEDFKTGKQYILNGDGTQCQVEPVRQNWTDPCVPMGSKKLYSSYYGIQPGQKLDVDMYYIKVPLQSGEQRDDMQVFVTVSKKDCSIVSESIKGSQGHVHYLMNVGLFNTTKGIKDPNVFQIPASCSKDELEEPIFRFKPMILP